MGHASAIVTFQGLSGLSKDRFENTFHFITDSTGFVSGGEALAIAGRLQDFYEGHTGGGNAIANWMSPIIEPTASVKVYDAARPTSGGPVLSATFPHLSAGSGIGLPEEVALCISYHTGINTPSHRGRVYIGPMTANASQAGGTTGTEVHETRPPAGLLSDFRDAGARLRNVGDGVAGVDVLAAVEFFYGISTVTAGVTDCNWALFSRKLNTWALVNGGWVDNEWDAQRRRRTQATTRVVF